MKVGFTRVELDILRQWYEQVSDVSPEYLVAADAAVYAKIAAALAGQG